MERTPAAAAAVQHVDGGHFAFGLDEHAARLRQVQSRRFGDFAGRRDGVAVVGAASGQDRGFHDGFVALGELRFMASLLTPRRQPQHRDGAGLGADEEADAAAGAARAQVLGRVVAVVVQPLRQTQDLGRAGLHAEAAALALLRIHLHAAPVGLSVLGHAGPFLYHQRSR